MIKVIFPPGCYGSFLSKCIFELTDLLRKRTQEHVDINFKFDIHGSSHDFWHNFDSQRYISFGHLPVFNYESTDTIVAVVPSKNHFLDYHDNQFIKHERCQLVSYLNRTIPSNQLQQKLSLGWNYEAELNDQTPIWILREWCSLWLENYLSNEYNVETYASLPAKIHVKTPEIFHHLYGTLRNISEKLGLKLLASELQCNKLQSIFARHQTLHNIQNRCDAWVNSILQGENSLTPCITLFDEAWIQYRLRCHGYAVECNGLNCFPANAKDFGKIIYKTA